MIPVLYESTAADFSTYGLGVLADCTSCTVTEERNGAYECILKYPITGQHYSLIEKERIVKVKPNDTDDDQAFRIYRITKPLSGIVTIYGQHISYDLANVAVMPLNLEETAPGVLLDTLLAADSRFSGYTDFSEAKDFVVDEPKSVRACLGGSENSMLSKWYGEFQWDNFTVKFHSSRGSDSGVVIEYGKNLTELSQDEDNSSVYTKLLPYAKYTNSDTNEEIVVTLSEETLDITTSEIVRNKTLIKDFSDQFDSSAEITEDDLRSVAESYIDDNSLSATVPTVKVSFEPLWKQDEYSALLEKINLCDTVTIRYSNLGVEATAKVIETEYDSLNERYKSITLGSAKSSMITTISDVEEQVKSVSASVHQFPAVLASTILTATNLITGQSGGYVVLNGDDNGTPYEFLVLDSPDIDSAVKVWRWNMGGLGYSSNGYNGPFETAITADGQIVADFITTGTLNANIIKAGVLQGLSGASYWNLETGKVYLSASSSDIVVDDDTLEDVLNGINTDISDVASEVETINTYIDIDPEVPSITLGKSDSNVQTVVDDSSFNVVENGTTTASVASGVMTTNILKTSEQHIGDYKWEVLSNGQLSLTYMGE